MKLESVIRVDDGNVRQNDTLLVTVKLSDKNGFVLAGGTTEVTPQRYQPNGADCDPTVWVAHLTAKAGTLTATA